MVDQKGRRGQHRRSSSAASYGSKNHEKDFQCWSSLRAIFGMMVPSCCNSSGDGGGTLNGNYMGSNSSASKLINNMSMIGGGGGSMQGGGGGGGGQLGQVTSSSVVTGTIFGQRKGRVNFCVQEEPSSPPLLLLEFAIPTHLLVKEMQSGLLRITLECDKKNSISHDPLYLDDSLPSPLFSEPVWSMYCNGRKVGFAMKKTSKSDSDPTISNLINLMQSVTSGAGVIPCRSNSNKHDLVGTLIHNKDGVPLANGGTLPNKDGALLPNKDGAILSNTNHVRHKDGVGSTNFDNDGALATKDFDNGNHELESGGMNSHPNGSMNLGPKIGLAQDDLMGALSVEKSSKEEDELIYMRANYERVVGSPDSEAFHMINPDGSQCQELSIFLTRT